MDPFSDIEGRVTRSLRRRLSSVDTDSTSRPGTPVLATKLSTIVEASPPRRVRKTGRKSATSAKAKVKTTVKTTSNKRTKRTSTTGKSQEKSTTSTDYTHSQKSLTASPNIFSQKRELPVSKSQSKLPVSQSSSHQFCDFVELSSSSDNDTSPNVSLTKKTFVKRTRRRNVRTNKNNSSTSKNIPNEPNGISRQHQESLCISKQKDVLKSPIFSDVEVIIGSISSSDDVSLEADPIRKTSTMRKTRRNVARTNKNNSSTSKNTSNSPDCISQQHHESLSISKQKDALKSPIFSDVEVAIGSMSLSDNVTVQADSIRKTSTPRKTRRNVVRTNKNNRSTSKNTPNEPNGISQQHQESLSISKQKEAPNSPIVSDVLVTVRSTSSKESDKSEVSPIKSSCMIYTTPKIDVQVNEDNSSSSKNTSNKPDGISQEQQKTGLMSKQKGETQPSPVKVKLKRLSNTTIAKLITRSLRRRLSSVDSDSTSRPGTPVLATKLSTIVEASPPRRVRETGRKSATSAKAQVKTPVKTTSNKRSKRTSTTGKSQEKSTTSTDCTHSQKSLTASPDIFSQKRELPVSKSQSKLPVSQSSSHQFCDFVELSSSSDNDTSPNVSLTKKTSAKRTTRRNIVRINEDDSSTSKNTSNEPDGISQEHQKTLLMSKHKGDLQSIMISPVEVKLKKLSSGVMAKLNFLRSSCESEKSRLETAKADDESMGLSNSGEIDKSDKDGTKFLNKLSPITHTKSLYPKDKFKGYDEPINVQSDVQKRPGDECEITDHLVKRGVQSSSSNLSKPGLNIVKIEEFDIEEVFDSDENEFKTDLLKGLSPENLVECNKQPTHNISGSDIDLSEKTFGSTQDIPPIKVEHIPVTEDLSNPNEQIPNVVIHVPINSTQYDENVDISLQSDKNNTLRSTTAQEFEKSNSSVSFLSVSIREDNTSLKTTDLSDSIHGHSMDNTGNVNISIAKEGNAPEDEDSDLDIENVENESIHNHSKARINDNDNENDLNSNNLNEATPHNQSVGNLSKESSSCIVDAEMNLEKNKNENAERYSRKSMEINRSIINSAEEFEKSKNNTIFSSETKKEDNKSSETSDLNDSIHGHSMDNTGNVNISIAKEGNAPEDGDSDLDTENVENESIHNHSKANDNENDLNSNNLNEATPHNQSVGNLSEESSRYIVDAEINLEKNKEENAKRYSRKSMEINRSIINSAEVSEKSKNNTIFSSETKKEDNKSSETSDLNDSIHGPSMDTTGNVNISIANEGNAPEDGDSDLDTENVENESIHNHSKANDNENDLNSNNLNEATPHNQSVGNLSKESSRYIVDAEINLEKNKEENAERYSRKSMQINRSIINSAEESEKSKNNTIFSSETKKEDNKSSKTSDLNDSIDGPSMDTTGNVNISIANEGNAPEDGDSDLDTEKVENESIHNHSKANDNENDLNSNNLNEATPHNQSVGNLSKESSRYIVDAEINLEKNKDENAERYSRKSMEINRSIINSAEESEKSKNNTIFSSETKKEDNKSSKTSDLNDSIDGPSMDTTGNENISIAKEGNAPEDGDSDLDIENVENESIHNHSKVNDNENDLNSNNLNEATPHNQSVGNLSKESSSCIVDAEMNLEKNKEENAERYSRKSMQINRSIINSAEESEKSKNNTIFSSETKKEDNKSSKTSDLNDSIDGPSMDTTGNVNISIANEGNAPEDGDSDLDTEKVENESIHNHSKARINDNDNENDLHSNNLNEATPHNQSVGNLSKESSSCIVDAEMNLEKNKNENAKRYSRKSMEINRSIINSAEEFEKSKNNTIFSSETKKEDNKSSKTLNLSDSIHKSSPAVTRNMDVSIANEENATEDAQNLSHNNTIIKRTIHQNWGDNDNDFNTSILTKHTSHNQSLAKISDESSNATKGGEISLEKNENEKNNITVTSPQEFTNNPGNNVNNNILTEETKNNENLLNISSSVECTENHSKEIDGTVKRTILCDDKTLQKKNELKEGYKNETSIKKWVEENIKSHNLNEPTKVDNIVNMSKMSKLKENVSNEPVQTMHREKRNECNDNKLNVTGSNSASLEISNFDDNYNDYDEFSDETDDENTKNVFIDDEAVEVNNYEWHSMDSEELEELILNEYPTYRDLFHSDEEIIYTGKSSYDSNTENGYSSESDKDNDGNNANKNNHKRTYKRILCYDDDTSSIDSVQFQLLKASIALENDHTNESKDELSSSQVLPEVDSQKPTMPIVVQDSQTLKNTSKILSPKPEVETAENVKVQEDKPLENTTENTHLSISVSEASLMNTKSNRPCRLFKNDDGSECHYIKQIDDNKCFPRSKTPPVKETKHLMKDDISEKSTKTEESFLTKDNVTKGNENEQQTVTKPAIKRFCSPLTGTKKKQRTDKWLDETDTTSDTTTDSITYGKAISQVETIIPALESYQPSTENSIELEKNKVKQQLNTDDKHETKKSEIRTEKYENAKTLLKSMSVEPIEPENTSISSDNSKFHKDLTKLTDAQSKKIKKKALQKTSAEIKKEKNIISSGARNFKPRKHHPELANSQLKKVQNKKVLKKRETTVENSKATTILTLLGPVLVEPIVSEDTSSNSNEVKRSSKVKHSEFKEIKGIKGACGTFEKNKPETIMTTFGPLLVERIETENVSVNVNKPKPQAPVSKLRGTKSKEFKKGMCVKKTNTTGSALRNENSKTILTLLGPMLVEPIVPEHTSGNNNKPKRSLKVRDSEFKRIKGLKKTCATLKKNKSEIKTTFGPMLVERIKTENVSINISKPKPKIPVSKLEGTKPKRFEKEIRVEKNAKPTPFKKENRKTILTLLGPMLEEPIVPENTCSKSNELKRSLKAKYSKFKEIKGLKGACGTFEKNKPETIMTTFGPLLIERIETENVSVNVNKPKPKIPVSKLGGTKSKGFEKEIYLKKTNIKSTPFTNKNSKTILTLLGPMLEEPIVPEDNSNDLTSSLKVKHSEFKEIKGLKETCATFEKNKPETIMTTFGPVFVESIKTENVSPNIKKPKPASNSAGTKSKRFQKSACMKSTNSKTTAFKKENRKTILTLLGPMLVEPIVPEKETSIINWN